MTLQNDRTTSESGSQRHLRGLRVSESFANEQGRRPSDLISFNATFEVFIVEGVVERLVDASPPISFMGGTIRPVMTGTTPPEEFQGAQERLAAWLNTFKNNTNEQIVKKLGNPSETATWESKGQKERLLRYKTASPNSTLDLYFLGDRVLTASSFCTC